MLLGEGEGKMGEEIEAARWELGVRRFCGPVLLVQIRHLMRRRVTSAEIYH